MDDAWLGGDDRVTLAVERSMSDCYIAQLRVCAKGAAYIYVHTGARARRQWDHPNRARCLRM